MSAASNDGSAPPRPRRVVVLLPLVIFLGLAALFLLQLYAGGDPSILPSALIGHKAPQTKLPPIAGLTRDGATVPGIDPADFTGAVTVLNVWASWCVPCHDEAPLLLQLAKDNRIPPDQHQLQGRARQCAAFPRPLRRSVRRRGRRRKRPRRDRLGRLWRAGDLRDRPRCPHRL